MNVGLLLRLRFQSRGNAPSGPGAAFAPLTCPGVAVRYPAPPMLDALLGSILGVLCALVGLMGAGLLGYQLLLLFGVPKTGRKAVFWAVAGFGVPAAIAGFLIGYRIGATLVYT